MPIGPQNFAVRRHGPGTTAAFPGSELRPRAAAGGFLAAGDDKVRRHRELPRGRPAARGMTTKCDIIRDSANAASCGMCRALGDGAAVPDGCLRLDPVPKASSCRVPGAANTRLYLFAAQVAPPVFGQANREACALTIANYSKNIANTEQSLMDDYGVDEATASIAWPDYQRCLWNTDGLPGGQLGHKYFDRADANMQGLHPSYPLGGDLASHLLWKDGLHPGPMPLTVDYLMNPDLFTILLLAFLVVLLGVLVWKAIRDTRRADREEERKGAAAAAEARRAAGIPDDPGQVECREYVEALEKEGFDMGYYRRRCGLPPVE